MHAPFTYDPATGSLHRDATPEFSASAGTTRWSRIARQCSAARRWPSSRPRSVQRFDPWGGRGGDFTSLGDVHPSRIRMGAAAGRDRCGESGDERAWW